MIDNIELVATRLWALGIGGFELVEQNTKDSSLRSKVQSILDLNLRTKIDTKVHFDINIDFKKITNFDKFSESFNCKNILYDLNLDYVNKIDKYININQHNKNKDLNISFSRFYIYHFLSIFKNPNINKDVKYVIFEYIMNYLLNANYSKIIHAAFYELIRSFNIDPLLLIKYLTKLTESKQLHNYCFIISEILYFNSLNESIENEKKDHFYKSAIILLESLHNNNHKDKTKSKYLLNYLLLDFPSKKSFCFVEKCLLSSNYFL